MATTFTQICGANMGFALFTFISIWIGPVIYKAGNTIFHTGIVPQILWIEGSKGRFSAGSVLPKYYGCFFMLAGASFYLMAFVCICSLLIINFRYLFDILK